MPNEMYHFLTDASLFRSVFVLKFLIFFIINHMHLNFDLCFLAAKDLIRQGHVALYAAGQGSRPHSGPSKTFDNRTSSLIAGKCMRVKHAVQPAYIL